MTVGCKPVEDLHPSPANWLMLYLGVFQDLLWFRFEAGHSHTEIADRLFAVLKTLFESDSSKRVGPLESFADLERDLQHAFAKAHEQFELAFHLANWNFESWFNAFEFEHSSKFDQSKKFVDPNFAGYSYDLVFRYEYVGAELWQHGGVKARCISIEHIAIPQSTRCSPQLHVACGRERTRTD